MSKSEHFEVDEELMMKLKSDRSSPDRSQVNDILAKAASAGENLEPWEINKLVNAIGAKKFPEIKRMVIDVASDVRKSMFNGHVVVMAPIEIGNSCASNCDFCGWRTSNHEMVRSRVPNELILEQAKYLIGKGIYSIELVCGDDLPLVRDVMPDLIPEVRKLFPPNVKGRIQICTAALTKPQYEKLKEAGADGIIVWQETYNRDEYNKHITAGPKAFGIDDDWKVTKGGDGYTFRLQSQDRALEAGLEVALGSMLGLNGLEQGLNFEIISTIMHARHLIERDLMERGIDEDRPLIVGMPTWNKITTPNTDMRPVSYKDPTAFFSYIAAVYLLSIPKKKAWIFPNCRVPIDAQVEALKAGGVFTSTEVKLGPAGYIPLVLKEAKEAMQRGQPGAAETVEMITRLMKAHMGNRYFENLTQQQEELDRQEQFCHYHYSHKEYKRKFHEAGLHVAPETSIRPDGTLERLENLFERRLPSRIADLLNGMEKRKKRRASGTE